MRKTHMSRCLVIFRVNFYSETSDVKIDFVRIQGRG